MKEDDFISINALLAASIHVVRKGQVDDAVFFLRSALTLMTHELDEEGALATPDERYALMEATVEACATVAENFPKHKKIGALIAAAIRKEFGLDGAPPS